MSVYRINITVSEDEMNLIKKAQITHATATGEISLITPFVKLITLQKCREILEQKEEN